MADEKTAAETQADTTGDYSDVKITPDEKKSLFTDDNPESTKENISEKKDSSEQDDGKSEEKENAPVKIKIGDDELEEKTIKEALESHKNKAEWIKSNDEKAREIATARNALKPMLTFIDKLKDEGEGVADIKEAFIDRYGDEFGKTFDELIKIDLKDFKDPRDEELATVKAQLAALENEKEINAEKKELAGKFKLSEEQTAEVYDFAVKKFEETGQALSLEEAYKLMDYDKALEREAEAIKKAKEAKKPKVPDVPTGGGGAKTINKQSDSYADIDIGEYSGKLLQD